MWGTVDVGGGDKIKFCMKFYLFHPLPFIQSESHIHFSISAFIFSRRCLLSSPSLLTSFQPCQLPPLRPLLTVSQSHHSSVSLSSSVSPFFCNHPPAPAFVNTFPSPISVFRLAPPDSHLIFCAFMNSSFLDLSSSVCPLIRLFGHFLHLT